VRSAIGGFVTGLAVGMLVMLVLSGPAMNAAGASLLLTTAVGMLAFVAGALLGRRASRQEIRLSGRVFEFPQGFVMVEVALRRARSIIPVRVTQSE